MYSTYQVARLPLYYTPPASLPELCSSLVAIARRYWEARRGYNVIWGKEIGKEVSMEKNLG